MFVISIAALAVTVISAAYLTKTLTKPIIEIEGTAKQMAEGHLAVDISYESKDELGQLSENMRVMTKRIAYYMEEIAKATVQLSEGDLNAARLEPFLGDFSTIQLAICKLVGSLNNTLTQINQSADQVAQGSGQMAASAQSLAEDAADQIGKLAKESSTSSDAQAQMLQQVQMGIEQIASVVQNNSSAAQESSATIEELSAQSENLKEMVPQFKLRQ